MSGVSVPRSRSTAWDLLLCNDPSGGSCSQVCWLCDGDASTLFLAKIGIAPVNLMELDIPILAEELRGAIMDCNSDKVPAPMVLPDCFLRKLGQL